MAAAAWTLGSRPLFDEMTTFPVGEHDDLLDAAAFGTEHLLNTPEMRGVVKDRLV